MKKTIIAFFILLFLSFPVSAMSFNAPEAPDSAQKYIQEDTESFSEGLWYIISHAVSDVWPEVAQAARSSFVVLAIAVLLSILQGLPVKINSCIELIGTIGIAGMLIKPVNAYMKLGVDTINSLSEYGKLLIPVMTSAMAAQGATTSAVAIYTTTAMFDAILSTAISKLLIPMVYVFLCLSIVNSAVPNNYLTGFRNTLKWLMTWTIKIAMYIFTGYITVSGVISGTVDATAMKAAKIAISGAVPVVGGIISDASEAVLVSAGIMKNAAGIYGIFAMIALFILPFLKIGIQHVFLKLTAAVCGIFGSKRYLGLLEDFSTVMGFLLAMTGTICLLHLISTVCFMKGVT